MSSDDRKTITIPAETHERFVELHEEMRPTSRAPYWWTIERLVEEFDSSD